MKVCAMVHISYKDILHKVAKCFLDNGHEVIFLAWTHYDEERLAREFDPSTIYSPVKYMSENWNSIDISKLSYYQNKYDRLSLWDIYFAERRAAILNKEEAAKHIVGYIEYFEYMFFAFLITASRKDYSVWGAG